MFRKIAHLITLALAAGALLWAGGARANPAVPFKAHGQITIVANLQDLFVDKNTGDLVGPAVDQETGEGTHLGRYSLTIHALHDFTTGVTVGEGSYTAANGDTLNFTFVQPSNSPANATFNGGTGRFADATGSETVYGSNVTVVQQGSLLIITADDGHVGTISH